MLSNVILPLDNVICLNIDLDNKRTGGTQVLGVNGCLYGCMCVCMVLWFLEPIQ